MHNILLNVAPWIAWYNEKYNRRYPYTSWLLSQNLLWLFHLPSKLLLQFIWASSLSTEPMAKRPNAAPKTKFLLASCSLLYLFVLNINFNPDLGFCKETVLFLRFISFVINCTPTHAKLSYKFDCACLSVLPPIRNTRSQKRLISFTLVAHSLQKRTTFKKVCRISFSWGREKSNPFIYTFFLNMW